MSERDPRQRDKGVVYSQKRPRKRQMSIICLKETHDKDKQV